MPKPFVSLPFVNDGEFSSCSRNVLSRIVKQQLIVFVAASSKPTSSLPGNNDPGHHRFW